MIAQTDSVYYGTREELPKKEKVKKKEDILEKMNYGGSFQLFFGTTTFIYLAPTVGISPLEKLNVGLGPVYSYWSVKSGGKTYSQSLIGGQVYGRYALLENLSAVVHYDKLYQPDWNSYTPDHKIWVDYTMLGFAYTQPAGDNTVFYTSLLYNVTPHRSSIYPSNFAFQFGITVGF